MIPLMIYISSRNFSPENNRFDTVLGSSLVIYPLNEDTSLTIHLESYNSISSIVVIVFTIIINNTISNINTC